MECSQCSTCFFKSRRLRLQRLFFEFAGLRFPDDYYASNFLAFARVQESRYRICHLQHVRDRLDDGSREHLESFLRGVFYRQKEVRLRAAPRSMGWRAKQVVLLDVFVQNRNFPLL